MKPGAATTPRRPLATAARRFPERWGGSANYARLIEEHRPIVRTLEDTSSATPLAPSGSSSARSAIVFLIACANVANLFIVRAESRRRDLAVRSALGAGRAGLIRSQMAEAILLAVVGGRAGASFAWLGVPLLVAQRRKVWRTSTSYARARSLLFTVALQIWRRACSACRRRSGSRGPALGDPVRRAGSDARRRGGSLATHSSSCRPPRRLVLLVLAGCSRAASGN